MNAEQKTNEITTIKRGELLIFTRGNSALDTLHGDEAEYVCQLETENEALRKERDVARKEQARIFKNECDCLEHNLKLEQERDRLREALESLLTDMGRGIVVSRNAKEKAKAALQQPTQDESHE